MNVYVRKCQRCDGEQSTAINCFGETVYSKPCWCQRWERIGAAVSVFLVVILLTILIGGQR